MCESEYNKWCDSICNSLLDNIQYIPYLDPAYAQDHYVELASEFSWRCPCNHNHVIIPNVFTCLCDEPDVQSHGKELLCQQCGTLLLQSNLDNFDKYLYFKTNGDITYKTYYIAEKNFMKFLNAFQYSHCLYATHNEITAIKQMVVQGCTEKTLFQYMKKHDLHKLYEYIPRFLKGVEDSVQLLSKEEVHTLHYAYLDFTKWYGHFRKGGKRQSLPHRGFLFSKLCGMHGITRFDGLVREPKLRDTQLKLNNVWKQYKLK